MRYCSTRRKKRRSNKIEREEQSHADPVRKANRARSKDGRRRTDRNLLMFPRNERGERRPVYCTRSPPPSFPLFRAPSPRNRRCCSFSHTSSSVHLRLHASILGAELSISANSCMCASEPSKTVRCTLSDQHHHRPALTGARRRHLIPCLLCLRLHSAALHIIPTHPLLAGSRTSIIMPGPKYRASSHRSPSTGASHCTLQ